MKKKLPLLVLALGLTSSLMQTHAQYDDYPDNSDFKVDGICYKIVDGDAIVTFGPYDILACVGGPVIGACPNGYEGDVVIPETVSHDGVQYNVTAIDEMAFYMCENLTSVVMPPSITSIGEWAFNNCWAIKELRLPESLKSIGENAFSGCYEIKEFNIPESLQYIGAGAFRDCNNLEAFYGPNTTEDHRLIVMNGKAIAFAGSGLTHYEIPDGVSTIGSYAFSIHNNVEYVEIPESVDVIESYAFQRSSIKHVKLPGNLKQLNYYTFMYSSLESIELPENIEDIPLGCFMNCSRLKSVKWPNNLKSIGSFAFSYCINLEEVVLPALIRDISFRAFEQCENLKFLVIPDSEVTIGSEAFVHCSALESIKVFSADPLKLNVENNAFVSSIYNNCILYVPFGSSDIYKRIMPWCKFKNIEEMPEASVEDVIDDSKANSEIFTIDGKRVDIPRRGILYIKDGRKVIL